MSNEQGTGFRICGMVEKVFAAPSGKFCKVTISCLNARDALQKVDVVAFSDGFAMLSKLGQGETVQVTGNVAMEKLTDKARAEVKIDGYAKWVPMLVAKGVKVIQSVAPAGGAEPAGW